jgi:chemotaxis methyl-accepting protein methylase
MSLTDEELFEALSEKISSGAGLALDVYKDKCIRRRIAVRMRACGVHTYSDYMRVLEQTPAEYERLRDALTINVTRFFRNPETWQRVQSELAGSLWPRSAPLRCWSAGCASGEEAYTLAILAAEVAASRGDPGALAQVHIDASDIDRQCLERARAACYPAGALADAPAGVRERYFEPAGAEFRVVAPVRRAVQVGQLDLTRGHMPVRDYHLIACRNVVIYFDRPMQDRLFTAFAHALVPGGLLVLGKVETLFGVAREFFTVVDARERIFRRLA